MGKHIEVKTQEDRLGHTARQMAERGPPQVMLESSDGRNLKAEFSGSWDRLFIASGNAGVFDGIIAQSANLGSSSKAIDSDAANFVFGFVDSMEPKDAAEALLLTQMAATHQATMLLARNLNQNKMPTQQDAASKGLNKLARTFSAQMETLKRYRSKGQQTVRVERVTVQDGGQAIVGGVRVGGGSEEK